LGENREEIRDFYEENEGIVEYKLEYRYIPVLINNIYYRITLGTKFDNSIIFLLNIKIKLLQNYIYFREINSE